MEEGWKKRFHQVMKGAPVSPKGCRFLLLCNPGFLTSLNKGSFRTEEREETLPVSCCGLPGKKRTGSAGKKPV